MTKFVKVLCLFLSLCLLFCSCSTVEQVQTVSCGELILTLPASYMDLSDQDYATGFSCVYGFENEAVLALSESRASLEEYYPDMNAEQYAIRLVEVNQYDCQVGKLGDLVTFTYNASTQDTDITYLCGVYMAKENFWCVQFYCPTEEFEDNQEKFMDYLQKIQVQETLTN